MPCLLISTMHKYIQRTAGRLLVFLIIIIASLPPAAYCEKQEDYIGIEKKGESTPLDQALYLLHRNHPVEAHSLLSQLEGRDEKDAEIKTVTEVTSLLCQASLLEQSNDLNGAERLLLQASNILKGAEKKNWKKITTILIHRSSLLSRLSRPLEAEACLTAALSAARNAAEAGTRLESLVLKKKKELFQNAGNYEESLREAIVHYQEQLGKDHIYVGRGFYHLALLMEEKGRYEEAKKYYEKGMKIHEKYLGPQHPVIATFLTHLATMLRERGEFNQAKIYLMRAIAIYDTALQETEPSRIQALKTMIQRTEEVDLAPLTDMLIRFEEENFGPAHPNVARSLRYFAMLYEADRLYDKAEPMIRRALKIYEKAFPAENKEVLFTRKRLAACLFAQGEVDEAIDIAQTTLKIEQEKFGENAPATMAATFDLATYFQRAGRFEAAERLFRIVLSFYETDQQINRDSLKTVATNLIEVCLAQGKEQEARALRPLLQNERLSSKERQEGLKSCPRGYRSKSKELLGITQ